MQRWNLYLQLIRWDRPAGTYLLLWPTLSALWLAAEGFPGWHLLGVFALGGLLMRSAGCAINDVADRNFDRHVKRTAQRPVTIGAVSVREAIFLAAFLVLCAFALVLTTNSLTIAWSVGALIVAVIYPFTKRFLAMPQAILGVAFSFGIPMAFASVKNTVPFEAGLWFIGNLFWVLAYDTQYAMVDRDDDLRIGLRTSAITLGRFDVAGVMCFDSLSILMWILAGRAQQMGWPFYLALLAAGGMMIWHYSMIRFRSREGCLKAFSKNHWIGLMMFMGVILNFVIHAPA
jgi:4-hydroxybenzoate polyprenyltransferase